MAIPWGSISRNKSPDRNFFTGTLDRGDDRPYTVCEVRTSVRMTGAEKIMKENASASRKILESAYRCIAKKGYAHASLRDIAEDAGVALSQLNYYYKNKEGLFTEVVRRLSADYLREVERRLEAGKTPRERFRSLIAYFKTMMHDNPDLNHLLFDLISMSIWNPSFKLLLSSLFDDISGLLRKYIFTDATCQVRYGGLSAEALAKSTVGTLFGTSLQYTLNPSDVTLIESLDCLNISCE